MGLRLYNTFTKSEENFKPLKEGHVSMYTCGPTVYGRPHIGNYSSFLMADLLRRWLEVGHGYTVTHVKNITDVGHLVADGDDGEDKVEKQARLESGSTDPRTMGAASRTMGAASRHVDHRGSADPLLVAKRYTDMYLEDEKALNMIEPEHRPRASAYVKEMIEITKKLIEKGNAYETADGVYFAVESFPAYGRLSGNTLEKLDSGARISVDEAKRHPADFALWKKCVGKNASHILRWPSPWGEGFPGWHIECSAMSSTLLGKEIDIHTGGEDNIFPHHECEIAQSECASGHRFVRLWLHKRRIDLAGEKMSKSLGNVLGIPDIVEKGYSPMDLRYLLLSVHYRTNLKFSFENLDAARKSRLKILEWMTVVDTTMPTASTISHGISESIHHFKEAMDSDLNTSGAIADIFSVMNLFYKNSGAGVLESELHEYAAFISMVRRTFGCFEPEALSIPSEIQSLLDKRMAARNNKNFSESDRLRDEIKKLGYEVRDEGKMQTVKKL